MYQQEFRQAVSLPLPAHSAYIYQFVVIGLYLLDQYMGLGENFQPYLTHIQSYLESFSQALAGVSFAAPLTLDVFLLSIVMIMTVINLGPDAGRQSGLTTDVVWFSVLFLTHLLICLVLKEVSGFLMMSTVLALFALITKFKINIRLARLAGSRHLR